MDRRPTVLVLMLIFLVIAGVFQGFGAETVDRPEDASVDGIETVNVHDGRLVKYDFDIEEDAIQVPNRAGTKYEGVFLGNRTRVSRDGDPAFRFDGLPGQIDIKNSDSLSTRRTVTVAFWIRLGEEQQANLLGRYGSSHFYLDGNQIHFMVMNNGTELADLNSEISVGEWTHIVGAYDHERGAQLFVNGDLVASQNTSNVTLGRTARDFQINMGGWNDGFYGSLDEFSLWNRSLSETEIQMLSQGRERSLILSPQLRIGATLLLLSVIIAFTIIEYTYVY